MENISFQAESSSVLAKVAKDLKILPASQHHLPTTQLTTPHKTYATATANTTRNNNNTTTFNQDALEYITCIKNRLCTYPRASNMYLI